MHWVARQTVASTTNAMGQEVERRHLNTQKVLKAEAEALHAEANATAANRTASPIENARVTVRTLNVLSVRKLLEYNLKPVITWPAFLLKPKAHLRCCSLKWCC